MRRFLAGALLGLISIASSSKAIAAPFEVESFTVDCKDQQELSPDNVFVVIEVDGNDVGFDIADLSTPKGAHKAKAMRMTTGTTWNFDAALLAKMKFNNTLKVTVLEFDGVKTDKFLDTGHITTIGTGTRTQKGGLIQKFEYEAKWKVK